MYSPIQKIYVKNFRNLGEVIVEFNESPIVALLGENEAGKTSLIKAFSACSLNASPREQKGWIRDGTDMFGVAIELQDGTKIVRVKESKGANSYKITDKNNNVVWNTNKITDGLPVEVQKLMGLIAEPETGEFLHIRSYEDQLLFATTPNSTNYKVMYSALKIEQLTKAIKLGSKEANDLKSNINTRTISVDTIGEQLRGVSIRDMEPLTNIKNRIITQVNQLNKLIKAKELIERKESSERKLGALALIDMFKLQPIEEVLASRLSNASRIIDNRNNLNNLYSSIKDVEGIKNIDYDVINKLDNLLEKYNMLNAKKDGLQSIFQTTGLGTISEVLILRLDKVKTLLERNKQSLAQLNILDINNISEIADSRLLILNKLEKLQNLLSNRTNNEKEVITLTENITNIHEYLKQKGVAVETCPKCGEAVIFDIDKIGE